MGKRGQPRASPRYGNRLGHAIFHWCIQRFGVVPAYVMLMLIIPYYVVFRPSARRSAAPYLRHRFPDLSPVQRLAATVKYFYAFGQVLIDQAAMGVLGADAFKVEFPGAGQLYESARARSGIVLLTTHAGAWQTSMASMDALNVPVHFHLRLEPHTTGRHFFDLAGNRKRFNIISPDGFLGGMVEMTNALNAGECAAVMGDRAWGGRTRRVPFLGDEADFPITPYHLALLTGADVGVLLTVRTGRCAYRIEHVRITQDQDFRSMPREEAIDLLLQRYVKCLEEYLERNPLMWFNFFDFWDDGEKSQAG
ncbi:MAG: hypothetical protein ACE5HE_00035 [Phycisphaerae bacterium]